MKVLLQNNIPNRNEQEILRDFLFMAIYVPPGENSPDRAILNDPKLAAYYQNWGRKNDRALFAHLGKQVIGACWSRCFSKDKPGYGTITPDIPELSIAVLSTYRGKGIGTLLLGNFLGDLQSDYAAVSLSVNTTNPAKNLYQRFGFVKYCEKDLSLIMIKIFDQK